MCQIKRGCKLTCGAPHPPLSGSPCLCIVMLITLQFCCLVPILVKVGYLCKAFRVDGFQLQLERRERKSGMLIYIMMLPGVG